jgi:phosphoribosylformylglycinamidine synthase PurS subunit
MKYTAEIDVMPLKALLDPQGKAITMGLANMGLSQIGNVRMGKHITLEVDADNVESANEKVDTACKKLLCNPIIEGYHFVLQEMVIG